MKKLLSIVALVGIFVSFLLFRPEGNSARRSIVLALWFVDRDGYPLAGVEIYRQPQTELVGIGDTYGRWQQTLAVDDDLALTLRKERDGQQLLAERYYRQPIEELREVIRLQ